MAKIAPRIDWLGTVPQPPEGRDDRRYPRDDRDAASPDASEIVPAAIRSASIGSSVRSAQSREQANGRGRQLALGRELAPERGQLGCGSGSRPCQSSHVVSSKVACWASSST